MALMILIMMSELLLSQMLTVFMTLRAHKSSGHNQQMILFQALLMGLYYLSLHISRIKDLPMTVLLPFVGSAGEGAFLLEGKIRLLPAAVVLAGNAVKVLSLYMIIERTCLRRIRE